MEGTLHGTFNRKVQDYVYDGENVNIMKRHIMKKNQAIYLEASLKNILDPPKHICKGKCQKSHGGSYTNSQSKPSLSQKSLQ